MNCHERTVAALNRQQPDQVPVFSCTEEQNQVYEILGEEGSAVPFSLFQEGITGAVDERFEAGEYYLTELVLAGEVMKEGLAPLAAVRICEGLLSG